MPPREKKRKIDYGALNSPFMRIPRMDVCAARALLDIKIREIYQLRGRDPQSLLADAKKARPSTEDDILNALKIAVDFAERDDGTA